MPPQNNQNPISQNPQNPPENNEKKPEPQVASKMVETYAGDIADAIEESQGQLVKKIIHDEEAREEEKRNLSPESRKNKLYVTLGTLLILAGVGLLTFLFSRMQPRVVEVAPQFTPMIFTDKTAFVEVADLNKDELVGTFFDEINTADIKYGGIEAIYLTNNKKIVGLREFAKRMGGNLVLGGTNQVDDNFLLGAYAWETRSPFILIKVRSMPDVFQNLRDWEGRMYLDLHGLFGMRINADTNYLVTKEFTDSVVENKNARVLYDNEGIVTLMYVYVDDTHIVLTRDPFAAHEVITRLAGVKIQK